MKMKKLIQGIAAAGFIVFAGNSFAVTADGSLGATSTGTVDIDVTIGDLIQISGLVPMTGNTYTPGAAVTDNTPACVYRNGASDYEVTATSSNGAGTDFFLSDGAATPTTVVYDVTFDDGSSGAVNLDNATLNSTFTNANTTIADCSAGTGGNVTIAISIPEFDATNNGLGEVPAGTYSDELSILVAPR